MGLLDWKRYLAERKGAESPLRNWKKVNAAIIAGRPEHHKWLQWKPARQRQVPSAFPRFVLWPMHYQCLCKSSIRPCACFFYVSRHFFFSPNLRGRAEKKTKCLTKKKNTGSVSQTTWLTNDLPNLLCWAQSFFSLFFTTQWFIENNVWTGNQKTVWVTAMWIDECAMF